MIHERKKAFMIGISKNQQKPKQVSADGFLYSFALEEELFLGGVILGAFVGVGGRGLIFNKESGSTPAPIGLNKILGIFGLEPHFLMLKSYWRTYLTW